MAQGFFITGTDTNVGKTVLSALLCAALPARYWKPIQTGSREGTDREQVIRWAGLTANLAAPEAYIFQDPVSPHLAARNEGVEISLDRISMPEDSSGLPLIVEGAGGVMAPVNSRQFMLDLMMHMSLPVILAARSTLGTINHTVLSLRALHEARLSVLGVVLIGPENPENQKAIEHYGEVRIAGRIPELKEINRKTLCDTFTKHFNRELFA
jgi:dethiobiotin synthetase